MTDMSCHRLEGLEPDNLLAFLALIGLLRALEHEDQRSSPQDRLYARVAWGLEDPPIRPRLHLVRDTSVDDCVAVAMRGLEALAASHEFGERKDLNYSRTECRELLCSAAKEAHRGASGRTDLLAALVTDAAIKDVKEEPVDPTPLCLQFGQGHQHFLERLTTVPRTAAPPPRGRSKRATVVSAEQCLREALFEPWHRDDPTPAFRWDPEEDVRYALMAGDPTDAAYKAGTQHGANRLAAVGLAALTVVPQIRMGRVRPAVIGGKFDQRGFSFTWPIWRDPASLAAIRALLANPDLQEPEKLRYLGVAHVVVVKRISVGKFMNFTRGRIVQHVSDHV